MYYLVKFSKDWADEFNADGFSIYEKTIWDDLYQKLKNNKDQEASFYFGTNEGWDDESIGDFLNSIKVTPITAEEKYVMQTLFGSNDYGIFPDFENMVDLEDA